MKLHLVLPLLLFVGALLLTFSDSSEQANAQEPTPAAATPSAGGPKTFAYDCEAWAEGLPPKDVFVVEGDIQVATKDGNKALVINPTSIVDANAQLGESALGDESVTARILASKRGRSVPRFGLSVHGNSGHRLILNCAKKQLELSKNDVILKTAPFTWTTDTWTHLKLEAKQHEPGKWVINAKAWAAGSTEPTDTMISIADDKMKGQGKAAIWGTPFSELPIYFDDIKIEAAVKP